LTVQPIALNKDSMSAHAIEDGAGSVKIAARVLRYPLFMMLANLPAFASKCNGCSEIFGAKHDAATWH
jgi:hypothetical protein